MHHQHLTLCCAACVRACKTTQGFMRDRLKLYQLSYFLSPGYHFKYERPLEDFKIGVGFVS